MEKQKQNSEKGNKCFGKRYKRRKILHKISLGSVDDWVW